MKVVGEVTLVVLAAGAAVAAFVGIRSIPDVRRYLKMRNM
ncbi:MAG: hypothetical protein ABR604_03095 [Jatrophihabitantaceae bacterium]